MEQFKHNKHNGFVIVKKLFLIYFFKFYLGDEAYSELIKKKQNVLLLQAGLGAVYVLTLLI